VRTVPDDALPLVSNVGDDLVLFLDQRLDLAEPVYQERALLAFGQFGVVVPRARRAGSSFTTASAMVAPTG
jgi:hypothetical protein